MAHSLRTCISGLFLFIACTLPSLAQLQWQSLGGPLSSDVRSFALAPNGDMYILVNSAGDIEVDHLLRSKDDGATWQLVSTFEDALPYTVAVAPDGILYIGTHFNILRSTDGGANWTEKKGAYGFTYKFVFGQGGLILAPGNFNGKYTNNAYSTDNGETWQVLPPPRTDGPYITDLAIDASGDIYAATYRDNIYRTTDLGASWNAVPDSGAFGAWFLFATHNGSRLAALADWTMTYSTDQGATWALRGQDVGIVYTCANNGNSGFASGRDRDTVFASTDDGNTWRVEFVSPVPGNGINALSFDGQDNIYICTRMGLYRKSPGAGAMRLFFHEGPPVQPKRLFSAAPNAMFVATRGYGQYTVDAASGMWGFLPVPVPLHEEVLSFEQDSEGKIFAFSDNSVSRSTDNGNTWNVLVTQDSIRYSKHNALSSTGTLYAATFDFVSGLQDFGGIRYAQVRDLIWRKMAFHTDTVLALEIDAQDRLYASDGYALYRTTDDGGAWTTVKTGNVSLIYIAGDNSIYIAGRDGMYVSSDGAATWVPVPFQYATQIVALAKDTKGRLFAALNGTVPLSNDGGVYASFDGGATWSESNAGFPSTSETHKCADIALDSEGHLNVALETGVYRTSVPTGIEIPGERKTMTLSPAYPNPVSAGNETAIAYRVERAGMATLTVYSTLGREVRKLTLGASAAGEGTYRLSTVGFMPGVYRYVVTASGSRTTGSFIVR